jgi:hypothetical protein
MSNVQMMERYSGSNGQALVETLDRYVGSADTACHQRTLLAIANCELRDSWTRFWPDRQTLISTVSGLCRISWQFRSELSKRFKTFRQVNDLGSNKGEGISAPQNRQQKDKGDNMIQVSVSKGNTGGYHLLILIFICQ